MLIKIAANAVARRDVLDIGNIFRAKAVDVSDHTITLEVNQPFSKPKLIRTMISYWNSGSLLNATRKILPSHVCGIFNKDSTTISTDHLD